MRKVQKFDFEYNFPVDSSSGDNTFRRYAPMSAVNAEWDTERLSGRKLNMHV